MRTIPTRSTVKRPGIPTMLLILVAVLAVGAWGLMIFLGIVGAAVGFWPSLGAFLLLRFIILPVNRGGKK